MRRRGAQITYRCDAAQRGAAGGAVAFARARTSLYHVWIGPAGHYWTNGMGDVINSNSQPDAAPAERSLNAGLPTATR